MQPTNATRKMDRYSEDMIKRTLVNGGYVSSWVSGLVSGDPEGVLSVEPISLVRLVSLDPGIV